MRVPFPGIGVPRDKLRRVTYKKDTAEAVAAVSMDPQAIAFVDLAAIPASGQSVKVLPVKFGQGEKARNIAPTAENIRSAMYPLSQRYFLYVHPKASDTAKDFARFLATCGGSEASPYTDTVKAMMEAYQKHGLIPLADEAITRAAKDAMAEAARSASSGQAAKARAEEATKARGERR
jgi:ABC-type phosphate transport system substrate-binding protein